MDKKVTISATEMKNADVQFISLVKRSASKIPFRVLKTAEESTMINLNGLFSRTKKQDTPVSPEVVGVAIPTSKNIEEAITKVEELGLTVVKQDTESHEDVVVLVTKEDYDPEMVSTIKTSEDIAVMVQTVEKGFYGWPEGSSFADNMSQSNFFPGLNIAAGTLIDTIHNQMYDASEPPIEEIKKNLEEFSSYVLNLTKEVPVTAFKMQDISISDAEAPNTTDTDLEQVAKEDEVPSADSSNDSEEAVEKVDTGESDTGDAVVEEKTVEKGDAEGEVVTGTDQEKMLEDFKAMLLDSMNVVTAKIDDVASKVEATTVVSNQALELSRKNDNALSGVVINSDNNEPEPVHKSQPSTGLFDTAFKLEGFTD